MNEDYLIELRKSCTVYNRKPPWFMMFAAVLAVAVLLASGMWAACNYRTEALNVSGTVFAEQGELVISSMTGTVDEVAFSEGDAVSEGDTVLRMNTSEYEPQALAYKGLIEVYRKAIDGYSKAIQQLSIYDATKCPGESGNINPFDESDESRYHSLYQSYLNNISEIFSNDRSADVLENDVRKIIDRATGLLYDSLKDAQNLFDQYTVEKANSDSMADLYGKMVDKVLAINSDDDDSITDPSNWDDFDDGSIGYSNMHLDCSKMREQAGYDKDGNQDVKQTTNLRETVKYTYYKAKSETYEKMVCEQNERLSNYNMMIADLRSFDVSEKVDAVESNRNPYPASEGGTYYAQYQTTLDEIKSAWFGFESSKGLTESVRNIIDRAVKDFNGYLTQSEASRAEASGQYGFYQKKVDDCSLKAPGAGYIHFMYRPVPGTVVTVGQSLFTVCSDISGESCRITVYIPSAARPYINAGDTVVIKFLGTDGGGLGTLSGKVKNISSDSTADQSGSPVCECVVQPDSIFFEDAGGNGTDIVSGMAADVNIHYRTQSWFDWAKGKLGLG